MFPRKTSTSETSPWRSASAVAKSSLRSEFALRRIFRTGGSFGLIAQTLSSLSFMVADTNPLNAVFSTAGELLGRLMVSACASYAVMCVCACVTHGVGV